jgi:hypothetical protein
MPESLDRRERGLEPTVSLDFAGSAASRRDVHEHFGEDLRFSRRIRFCIAT